jgi:RNA polymerase sigma-70 factor (ECF subfamily)
MARIGAWRSNMSPMDSVDPTRGGDEVDLIARARLDRAAFAPLYARYAPAIYRYCRSRLNGPEAAEDATSRVFAKALAALPRYRDGSFRSWLFVIAHNEIADAGRARSADAPLEAAAGVVDPGRSPEEAVLAREAARELRELLDRLPVNQRRVVELRLAGLTAPEVAAVVGRGVSAVRMDQLRAYARLREVLGQPERAKEARGGR